MIEANLLLGLLGWGKARELMLRGNLINAKECLRIGLVQHLIRKDIISSYIDNVCAEIVSNGANAMRLQKQLILEWERVMISKSISVSRNYFQQNFESDECMNLAKKFFQNKGFTD